MRELRNSVLEALMPARDLRATSSEPLPPTAALYIASTIADDKSGATAPVIAAIDDKEAPN